MIFPSLHFFLELGINNSITSIDYRASLSIYDNANILSSRVVQFFFFEGTDKAISEQFLTRNSRGQTGDLLLEEGNFASNFDRLCLKRGSIIPKRGYLNLLLGMLLINFPDIASKIA